MRQRRARDQRVQRPVGHAPVALRHRGRPRVGPGELALIRLLVREEEDRVGIIALEFGLTPHFVEQIACAG